MITVLIHLLYKHLPFQSFNMKYSGLIFRCGCISFPHTFMYVLLAVYSIGCHSSNEPIKLYEGPPQTSDQISIIKGIVQDQGGCQLNVWIDKVDNHSLFRKWNRAIHLLPGRHEIHLEGYSVCTHGRFAGVTSNNRTIVGYLRKNRSYNIVCKGTLHMSGLYTWEARLEQEGAKSQNGLLNDLVDQLSVE